MMGSAAPPGSSPDDQEVKAEAIHEREIPRSFAIATTEVTVTQYQEFLVATKGMFKDVPSFYPRVSPKPDCPMHGVLWFEGLFYCRWLSEKEGIPEDQMFYPPIREMMKSLPVGKLDLSARRLNLTGYRLPSEAEWEFACRAGTTTPYFFGRLTLLLPDYAHYLGNSGLASLSEAEARGQTQRVGQLKPNDLGLFDVYGNVREWCLDAFKPYPVGQRIVIDTTFQDPRRRAIGIVYTEVVRSPIPRTGRGRLTEMGAMRMTPS